MVDAEQLIGTLLDRIERSAVGSAKRFRMFQEANKQRLLMAEQIGHQKSVVQQLSTEKELALDKIGDWQSYAAKLRAIIEATDRVHLRAGDMPLPDPPEPLEFPIPF